MKYEDSPIACYLYNLHENEEMTIEEKIKEITIKYEKLKNKEKWDTLRNFFMNPIYTRIAYQCETYSNFGTGTVENKYIKTDISHEDAVKGNIYFYILLSVIGGNNKIVAHLANYFTYSEKTSQYLHEYGKEHSLQYEFDVGRGDDKNFILIMHHLVEAVDGHSIYKCIELPI